MNTVATVSERLHSNQHSQHSSISAENSSHHHQLLKISSLIFFSTDENSYINNKIIAECA